MSPETVKLPQDVIVGLLKELPDDVLQDIFWKVFIECEVHGLSDDEKLDIAASDEQFETGETVKWEDLQ